VETPEVSEKQIAVVVCTIRENTEVYQKLLTDAGLPCSIVESDSYSNATSFEVAVPESRYDEAFAVIEEYEES